MMNTNRANSMAHLPLSDAATLQQTVADQRITSGWKDFVGITASVACAIHCAAMPFVIGFLPALGLTFLADESFHKWMAGACFVFALAAFIPGWKRHRRCMPAAVAATGLAIVTAAAFALSGECCSACATESQTTTSTGTSGLNATALPSTEATCCDEHCDHCAVEADAAAAESKASSKGSPTTVAGVASFVTGYAAWWTPLGGGLLVFAHLLNRCFVSRCRCCSPAAD